MSYKIEFKKFKIKYLIKIFKKRYHSIQMVIIIIQYRLQMGRTKQIRILNLQWTRVHGVNVNSKKTWKVGVNWTRLISEVLTEKRSVSGGASCHSCICMQGTNNLCITNCEPVPYLKKPLMIRTPLSSPHSSLLPSYDYFH